MITLVSSLLGLGPTLMHRTVCTEVKSKGKISQNFVTFSEYMNFKDFLLFLSFQNPSLNNIFWGRTFFMLWFSCLRSYWVASRMKEKTNTSSNFNFVLRSIFFFLLPGNSIGRKLEHKKNLPKNWALSRTSLFFCILINYRKLIIVSRNLWITQIWILL